MPSMSLADELQKLADLRRRGTLTQDEFEQAKRKLLAGPAPGIQAWGSGSGVRRQSATRIGGLPLWAIATGPDPARGERRGHARGVIAVGDIATGVLAIGGIARGIVALGGVALGVVSAGGLAIGIAFAVGGGALGGVAFGGAAVGNVAVGGGAVGRYALGGGGAGQYVLAANRCDPEAVEFFIRNAAWIPMAGPALSAQSRNINRLCAPRAQAR